MTKYCGKDLLIQVGDGGSPESFTTVATIRSTSLTINNEQVDVTDKGDAPWRQLLEGCGIQSMSVSGSGIFSDDAQLGTMMSNAVNDTIQNYKIISGRGDSFDGPFQIASLERSGEYNAAEEYSISMESAAEISYTAP